MLTGPWRPIISWFDAGWSSLAARRAHNPKVVGSNPTPATNDGLTTTPLLRGLFLRTRGRWALGNRGGIELLDDATGLRTLLEPVVESSGFELVKIELTGPGGCILRLYIDSPGGILLEDCETVSKLVSPVLDVEDPIAGEYTLEVSSPGVDRPLVKPEHFEKVVGQRVSVRMRGHYLGRRRFTGVLAETTEVEAVVDVDGELYELPYVDMERAKLVPEFEGAHSRR